VPFAFMFLDSMPLIPSGKVDRKCLPVPDYLRPEMITTYVGPSTDTEHAIAIIWKKILNLKEVGVHDNFFDLGGYSLLATQIMSRINQLFNVQLPLRRLFEAGTIASMAEIVNISLWNAEHAQKAGIARFEEREVFEI